MFSIPDWDDDEDERTKGAKGDYSGKPSSKKKAKQLAKSVSTQLLSAVSKVKTDFGGINASPGQKRPLLDESGFGFDSHNGDKKKKKKKKNRDEKVSQKDHHQDKLSQKNSTDAVSSSSGGDLLRKGIRFANLADFCSFMDRPSKKRKLSASEDKNDDKKKKGEMKKSIQGLFKQQPDKSTSKDKSVTNKSSITKDPIKIPPNKKMRFDDDESDDFVEETPSKAKSQLKSSRFRYLNELLYTQPGSQSFKMFKSDLNAFKTYHEGYMEQVKKWPVDPLQSIIAGIMKSTFWEKNGMKSTDIAVQLMANLFMVASVLKCIVTLAAMPESVNQYIAANNRTSLISAKERKDMIRNSMKRMGVLSVFFVPVAIGNAFSWLVMLNSEATQVDYSTRSDKKPIVIADFGCGEARLARALPDLKVHSFDFVALNASVTPCDMSKTPLADESVDVAVFCLSLMGTNLKDYLKEANRVLKKGGLLKIAEVESRFLEISVENFIGIVQKYGFNLKWKDSSKAFFVFMDFTKVSETKKKAPEVSLKPCFYKKR